MSSSSTFNKKIIIPSNCLKLVDNLRCLTDPWATLIARNPLLLYINDRVGSPGLNNPFWRLPRSLGAVDVSSTRTLRHDREIRFRYKDCLHQVQLYASYLETREREIRTCRTTKTSEGCGRWQRQLAGAWPKRGFFDALWTRGSGNV